MKTSSKNYYEDSVIGYILEVDLKYPKDFTKFSVIYNSYQKQ